MKMADDALCRVAPLDLAHVQYFPVPVQVHGDRCQDNSTMQRAKRAVAYINTVAPNFSTFRLSCFTHFLSQYCALGWGWSQAKKID